MSGEFLVPLLLFLFFFIAGRRKKPKSPPPLIPIREKAALSKRQPTSTSLPKKEPAIAVPRKSSSYEVEKKQRRIPILSKEWKNKNSLQKAFVLSEILKRIDE